MTDTTRPCTVYYRDKRVEATFHKLGTNIYYDEGNNGHPRTVAIVELKTGEMLEAEPKTVTFTDKG